MAVKIDYTLPFKKWTVRQLTAEWRALDTLIYENDCFGVSDLKMHLAIGEELDRRGVEMGIDNEI